MITLRILMLLICFHWIQASGNSVARQAETKETTNSTTQELKAGSFTGSFDPEKARIMFEAEIARPGTAKPELLQSARILQKSEIGLEHARHSLTVTLEAFQGSLQSAQLTLHGSGNVTKVESDELLDWSIRHLGTQQRSLVLRFKPSDKARKSAVCKIEAESSIVSIPTSHSLFMISSEPAMLSHGYLWIEPSVAIAVRTRTATGLSSMLPIELPSELRPLTNTPSDSASLAFRSLGQLGNLQMEIEPADPELRRISISDFQLQGTIGEESAEFELNAKLRVRNPKGGSIELLRQVALSAVNPLNDFRLRVQEGRFYAEFEKPGDYPIRITFHAPVRNVGGWSEVGFDVVPGVVQPLILKGLGSDTQFKPGTGTRPERQGENYLGHVAANGGVRLAWKSGQKEAEGKLFYSAKIYSWMSVSPGLLRQAMALDLKVMQGELNHVVLALRGDGEITRVIGTNVLSWKMLDNDGNGERRMRVDFNEPQKDQVGLVLQFQQPLTTFPVSINPLKVGLGGATRVGGNIRITAEGAVRVEAIDSTGLSQISPDQAPIHPSLKSLESPGSPVLFTFRFSQADYRLQLQATDIQPEINASQILVYEVGDADQNVEADIELDVREAPIREVTLRIPSGFAATQVRMEGLADYSLTEEGASRETFLRILLKAPRMGRVLLQTSLERNRVLSTNSIQLERVEVLRAKTTRGHVGILAENGLRLSTLSSRSLTEITTAAFPEKLIGLQSTFRISDPNWALQLGIDRLPQNVQAESFHLFSIGEGIAYGSSLTTYKVTGAPLGQLRVALSQEYFNVEFTGKNIRSWRRNNEEIEVQLHTPITGNYSLLATYERPFKTQGDTLSFTGARPLDASSELGHSAVISANQFRVQPVNLSSNLVSLEPEELPAEYRLLFDAPLLAAYRYTTQPFNLQLQLQTLNTAPSLPQVVDRAVIESRVSSEGQVTTDARYLVKSKGATHFRVGLPSNHELWSVTVDGTRAVPVKDGLSNLIPLAAHSDPNHVSDVRLKMATKSTTPVRLVVKAPSLGSPSLLTEWKLRPESGKGNRLIYRSGNVPLATDQLPRNGFNELGNAFLATHHNSIRLAAFLSSLGLAGLVLTTALSRMSNSRKNSWRYRLGSVGILLCLIVLFVSWAEMVHVAVQHRRFPPPELSFVVPVQTADKPLEVEIGNVPLTGGLFPAWFMSWVLISSAVAIVASFVQKKPIAKHGLRALGWSLMFYSLLSHAGGGARFLLAAACFLLIYVVIPALRHWWNAPPADTQPRPDDSSASLAAQVSALALCFWAGLTTLNAQAAPQTASQPMQRPAATQEFTGPLADSVVQELRVEGQHVLGHVKVRWKAKKGNVLDLLSASAVLTHIDLPATQARIIRVERGGKSFQSAIAEVSGDIELEFRFETKLESKSAINGFTLPTQPGLVNQAIVHVKDLSVDIVSSDAAAIYPLPVNEKNGSSVKMVLIPKLNVWIELKPKSRNTRREAAMFFVEWNQLYIPSAGMVEGYHLLQVRPAQGELSELQLVIPQGMTVSDVTASSINTWRFDPDQRQLKISLLPAQSKPFNVLVHSQTGTSPIPYEQSIGLMSVEKASGEVGLVAVATGNEIALESAVVEELRPINLEDYPALLVEEASRHTPGLGLRRAYRHASAKGSLKLKAVAIQPDIRVTSNQNLTLGEDRTLLNANLQIEVSRAGIFKLSFELPDSLEVESISGQKMSHWTELKTGTQRVVTTHLSERSEGTLVFAVVLTGPGVRATTNWMTPNLLIREASKQRGQIAIVPELGLRPQVVVREGVTQLDPGTAGLRQQGTLLFGLLDKSWRIHLNLDQLDAWTQVTSLQQVSIADGRVRVSASLLYEIENAGIKSLRITLPTLAEGVQIRGDLISDFAPISSAIGATNRTWEIKLTRRTLGRVRLTLGYDLPLSDQAVTSIIDGIVAESVNSHKAFLSMHSTGRRQMSLPNVPSALQVVDWHSIPKLLRDDVQSIPTTLVFRCIEPNYQIRPALAYHETAKLLPARVHQLELTSVIADDATMLTRIKIKLTPGDKRLLPIDLPPSSKFWFAFVNQGNVWLWEDNKRILVPLEAPPQSGEATEVEVFYTNSAGESDAKLLNLSLAGPKFDLPLENIHWKIFLGDRWKIQRTTGTFQLLSKDTVPLAEMANIETYASREQALRASKSRDAANMINFANRLLTDGDPTQARRAFQNAYGLSTHDNAFNEDARVQLQNLKTQQGLIALNTLNARISNEPETLAAAPKSVLTDRNLNYTQMEAKRLLERNRAEDNTAQLRLVEKLIQQQDAAIAKPAAIRASFPEGGLALNFSRDLEVNPWAELKIGIRAAASHPLDKSGKLILLAIFPFTIGLPWLLSRLFR